MSPDPWTAFLEWLTTVLVPAWGELIDLLPYLVVIGVIGPIVTLLALMWGWYFLKRQRGRVRHSAVEAVPAPRDADGAPLFPPNTPFCEEHALIHPARTTSCQVDGGRLDVACPMDGTVRDASIQVCAACGTRYVLGVNAHSLAVTSADGPPEGGAAIA